MNNEYYKNLPKKRMGAGALILNNKNEILIVKPSYRTHWTLPGGVIEENETPRTACLREVKEETNLELKKADLLCIDYTSDTEGKGDSLQFVFFGGIIGDLDVAKIKVDGTEIVDWRFAPVEDAVPMLSDKFQLRMPICLEAMRNKTAVYLEDGKKK